MEYEPFSQRQKFVKIDKTIQMDGMSRQLRNRLCNALKEYYFEPNKHWVVHSFLCNKKLKMILSSFVDNYLKESIDLLPKKWEDCYNLIKECFYQEDFFVCYDVIEFVLFQPLM